jgi:hypothetical protein
MARPSISVPNKAQPAPAKAEPDKASAIKGDVQKRFDEANEKGFFGVTTDPTPDEHYTLDGVAAGKPTPETDRESAKKAAKARNQ